jgi:hypothetical protein
MVSQLYLQTQQEDPDWSGIQSYHLSLILDSQDQALETKV